MAARIQVVVEASDAASGVLRAITSQFGAMGGLVEELTAKNVSWGNVAERATTMVIDGLKECITTTTEYAEAVRNQALASGQSAEAASRFLQVLDDYQLTAEDAKTATRALTKDGLAPTVETLIQLSAEYQKLTTAEEKNAFVQDHLGRAGQQWLNLLDQGPDKIRAMNAAVDEKLILTDKDIAATEEYRLALDEWNDSIEASKISIGKNLLPVLTELLTNMQESGEAVQDNVKWWEYLLPIVGSVHAAIVGVSAATKENTDATNEEATSVGTATRSMTEYGVSAEEATENLKELESANAKTINSVIALTDANRDYEEKQDDILAKIKALQAEKAKLYPWEKSKIQDIEGQIDELNQSYAKNAEEFRKAMNKKLAMMALEKIAMSDGVAGFNKAEMSKAQAILETLDVATRSAFEEQLAMEMLTDAVADNQISVEKYGKILDRVMSDGVISISEVESALNSLPKDITITTNYITNGIPPTGTQTGGVDYGSPTCFIAGTPVLMSDGSRKNIEEIVEGEEVISYDPDQDQQIVTRVTKVFRHTSDEMLKPYYLLVNGVIGVTCEHLLYVHGEWIPAESLKIGSELTGLEGLVVVTSLQAVSQRVATYNLHVDHECHNYFANDVLVHNGKTGDQQGGVTYAGVPVMVGEGGPEPFFPAVNGRVVGHAEALHALSMGMGGGNIGPFYGNVTLEISEGAAGGLLSMR